MLRPADGLGLPASVGDSRLLQSRGALVRMKRAPAFARSPLPGGDCLTAQGQCRSLPLPPAAPEPPSFDQAPDNGSGAWLRHKSALALS